VIDALIHGRIYGKPQSRTGKSGTTRFVTANVRVPMADGESVFANVICFAAPVGNTLLALDDGASVSVSGELKVSTYVAKDGTTKSNINVTAHELLTPYHVQRRRKAVAKHGGQPSADSATTPTEDFNDPITF
jgi:single-stranded DNA-binding protein